MKTGAVIVAAGVSSRMGKFKPLLPMGQDSVIKRVIKTLQSAEADPIIVVTGNRGEELQDHLADMDVRTIHNPDYAKTQMFKSAKIGLRAIHERCDHILFTPGDIPLFTRQTVAALLGSSAMLAVPAYNGMDGHPLCLASSVVKHILADQGDGGLRGAIARCGVPLKRIPVTDKGILMDADTPEDYQAMLAYDQAMAQQENTVSVHLRIQVNGMDSFFGPGVATFMSLVDITGSMNLACKMMNMSYTKAWRFVTRMEEELGYPVLERKNGGSGGGGSRLTPEGRAFVQRFLSYQEALDKAAGELLVKHFLPAHEGDGE